MRNGGYDRAAAVQYANEWWNKANPRFHNFEVDCTNFVSQCLFAGGIAMNYTNRRDLGWWYQGYAGGRERWSYSWAVAHSLQMYLLSSQGGFRAVQVDNPTQLALGDVISYDWDGDNRFTHMTIVTAFDAAGYPLVNAHTNNSQHRFWAYRDSYAWTSRTQYVFIHMPDA